MHFNEFHSKVSPVGKSPKQPLLALTPSLCGKFRDRSRPLLFRRSPRACHPRADQCVPDLYHVGPWPCAEQNAGREIHYERYRPKERKRHERRITLPNRHQQHKHGNSGWSNARQLPRRRACNAQLVEHHQPTRAQRKLSNNMSQTRTVHTPQRNYDQFHGRFESKHPANDSPVSLLRVKGRKCESKLRVDEH
jgi:hypothetical protein